MWAFCFNLLHTKLFFFSIFALALALAQKLGVSMGLYENSDFPISCTFNSGSNLNICSGYYNITIL